MEASPGPDEGEGQAVPPVFPSEQEADITNLSQITPTSPSVPSAQILKNHDKLFIHSAGDVLPSSPYVLAFDDLC